jgi:hypothetical protein
LWVSVLACPFDLNNGLRLELKSKFGQDFEPEWQRLMPGLLQVCDMLLALKRDGFQATCSDKINAIYGKFLSEPCFTEFEGSSTAYVS